MRSSIKALIFNLFLASLILSPNTSAQWLQQNFPTNEYLGKVRFANETVGWILGNNFIYKTSDGGLNWQPQDSSMGFGTALYVLDDQVVFYSAFLSGSSRGIRRTTDGGLTWQTVDPFQFYYADFEFLSDQVGFVVGEDENDVNAVRMTTDGGATWNTISTEFLQTGYELEGITFVDNQKGWLVSYDGYVYHTIDGGINWMLQDSIRTSGYFEPIRDIFFITPDSGWAVGGIGYGLTARTTDGGDSWIIDTQSGPIYHYEVIFNDSKIGWFTGTGIPNYVARTANGGIDWQYQTLIPPNPSIGFESITMINENIGWMVGPFGLVYKTTNGGVLAIDENPGKPIPDKFTLEQNYPNPFNPATRIHYSLPTSNQVTLRVYNIAGQVVATLVNERQVAGNYEATFEANKLPAGPYFYKLTSGSFSQTRKMLLIK